MDYKKLRVPNGKQSNGLNELIDDMLKIREISNFVEIGSYAGESTIMFANKFIDAKIYCIDPWNDMDIVEYVIENIDIGKYTKPSSIEYIFDENTKNFNNITKIKLTSEEASSQFEDNSLDMVYIDGLHTAKYIAIDLEKWMPKLKSGGIISGHDYTSKFRKYTKYIYRYFGGPPDKVYQDKSWYYIKE